MSTTSAEGVNTTEEWVLGPENTPFYSKTWSPINEEPKAYIVFIHGFAEHISRYDHFLSKLAATPSSLHIMAFDQRGHGRTAYYPPSQDSETVKSWKTQGKTVKIENNTKRKTGGWAKVMPDIEWFVIREGEKARAKGKKLFLWGHSMGGAESLAFVTRPSSPPSTETVASISGVIASGPLIRQTKAAPGWQVKSGSGLASLGLGNVLIPAPLVHDHLSHNPESNQRNKEDPMCEQVGSLRGIADMLNGGSSLDQVSTWDRWPKGLPLLVYHGEEDLICDPKAAERFAKGVKGDSTFYLVKGMYHETHNELEPTPTELAKYVSDWVHQRLGETAGEQSKL